MADLTSYYRDLRLYPGFLVVSPHRASHRPRRLSSTFPSAIARHYKTQGRERSQAHQQPPSQPGTRLPWSAPVSIQEGRVMLPGVELARRRRVHYHGDVVGVKAGDHQHKLLGAATSHTATGVVGAALAARNRLQEKLRGAASSSSSTSRWGWRRREPDGGASSRQQNILQELQQDLVGAASTEFRPPRPVPGMPITTSPAGAKMRRTLSKTDVVCAVCLDEVRERHDRRVTQLPCSHRYHSDCVLPWLAIQRDCPCCRTLVPVPSVEILS
uniref:Uncharacterized protein n=1 Tax=Avena sativa TaxID=4498 RepID=A0ACD5TDP2_AVESA